MPKGKLIIAAVLGGLAMFIWSAISHSVIPLYNSALQKFINEDAVVQAIQENAPNCGTYYLPNYPNLHPNATEEEKTAGNQKMEKRMKTGPMMFAFIRLGGMNSIAFSLVGELIANIAAVFFFVLILSAIPTLTLSKRILISIGIGFIIIFSDTISQSIWYSSGLKFTLAETIDQVIGWLVAGLVAGKILPTQKIVAA